MLLHCNRSYFTAYCYVYKRVFSATNVTIVNNDFCQAELRKNIGPKTLSEVLGFPFPHKFNLITTTRSKQTAIMATELTVQSERAYQKQPHIFVNQKTKRTKSTRVGKGGRRWYKDVGLGFRTPKTAIEGTYIGTKDRMRRLLNHTI